MTIGSDSYSRIAKLFVDRDDLSVDDARRQLEQFRLVLRCGPEVASSPTLQAAALTAANVANRCFPGGVRVDLARDFPLRVPWTPGSTFLKALVDIAGPRVHNSSGADWEKAQTIAFGSMARDFRGLQATFDGWTAAVSPFTEIVRLPEREACVLAGVLVGGLAISELFLGNFGISIEAGSQPVGLSLWRPDMAWDDETAAAVDMPLNFLPGELWLLGLGHLGQAFAWACSFLPYSNPTDVRLVLQDFDRLVEANLDTGLLSRRHDLGRTKTRIAADFLENRGFQPRLVERRFDENTCPQRDDPAIVLSGMDSAGPRHLLDQAGFDMVVDCGVGGTVANFDSMTLQVLPTPHASAESIWPPRDAEDVARRERFARKLANSRGTYQDVATQHRCGHVELAGRSIAVPFVGAVAAALSLSELCRRLMGGPSYVRIQSQLGSIQSTAAKINIANEPRLRTTFQAVVYDE
ncbi:MAG: hypothetical protein CMJ58_00290 [Planctomycetaceae bacterium]|nr:hypothetical protein [Planctomycetaceae bacterium]